MLSEFQNQPSQMFFIALELLYLSNALKEGEEKKGQSDKKLAQKIIKSILQNPGLWERDRAKMIENRVKLEG